MSNAAMQSENTAMALEAEVDALIASRPGAEAIAAANLERAIPLNDFIWMSTGSSNSYALNTSEGRIIINTGMGFEALTHKRLFDQACPGETRYIICTQGHVDHVGGVAHFREPGATFVAQASNQYCQLDDARIAKRRSAMSSIWFGHIIDEAIKLAKDFPEAFIQDTPKPDLTFRTDHRFQLGGLDVELISTPGGETIDSCVVWLAEQRILFTGNLFGPLFPHFPNFNTIRGDRYRFFEAYLDSLRTVRELKPEVLITGHGEPIKGAALIEACLNRLENAVEYVHKETLTGIKNGDSIWDLMDSVQLPPEYQVGQGYGLVRWGVRTIWESYLGWFHQLSTTELYPQRFDSIAEDLLDLVGTDALVDKAMTNIAKGKAVEAIYFAETVLATDSDHAGAKKAMAAAHQHLLENPVDRDNFWSSGWLKYQRDKYSQ